MLNLLIADDNIYYAKSLVNYIASRTKSIKLVGIATDGEEVLSILEREQIDLILLDLKMPKCNGLEVIEKIEKMQAKKKPRIILISGDIESVHYLYTNELISDIVNKTEDISSVYEKLENIASKEVEIMNIDHVKRIVTAELMHIGFNFKHKGTNYLLESIMYIYEAKDRELLDNLENYVYRVIGCQHHKNAKNIKSNILKATDYMYAETSFEKVKKRLGMVEERKPTPKSIISIILAKIDLMQ